MESTRLQVNHFEKHRFTAETHFFGQSGLRTGGSLWVISDIHKVRTNPEVRIAGMGARYHPEAMRVVQTPKNL